MEFKDDIVAISSPPGMGAISIIRVSGPNAIKKTSSFLNLKKEKNLEKEKSHTLHFGEFIFKDEIVDEVVVSIFKNIHGYFPRNQFETEKAMLDSYIMKKPAIICIYKDGLPFV